MDVASWLRDLDLERYEAPFRENGVSAEILCLLTADDLKELGVAAVGHRRQLLAAIAKLNEQRTAGTSTRRSSSRARLRNLWAKIGSAGANAASSR